MKKKTNKLPKDIVDMKVKCWNKRTKAQQDKTLFHLIQLISFLDDHRKFGISDDFTATY